MGKAELGEKGVLEKPVKNNSGVFRREGPPVRGRYKPARWQLQRSDWHTRAVCVPGCTTVHPQTCFQQIFQQECRCLLGVGLPG